MSRIRQASPEGVKRPFKPNIGVMDVEEQKADALEHIARALSAIDHNLEVLTNQSREQIGEIKQQTQLLGRIMTAVSR